MNKKALRMQMSMMFVTNDVKIYDIVSRRSFTVNRKDIDVKHTILHGGPYLESPVHKPVMAVFVHDRAKKKTPRHSGIFFVSNRTYSRITTVPRKDW